MSEEKRLLVNLLNEIEISAKDILDVLRGYVEDGLYVNLDLVKRVEKRAKFTEEECSLAYQCMMKGIGNKMISLPVSESYKKAKDYFKGRLDMSWSKEE